MQTIRAGQRLHAPSCHRTAVRPTARTVSLATTTPLSRRCTLLVTCASSPDTEEARSPLDAPQEWEAPVPSKRPDIFPEFEKLDRVPLPKMPLPGDPEMPDEEIDQAQKRTEPGDPDPESKPGEPSEPEPEEGEPGQSPEKSPNIPTVPE